MGSTADQDTDILRLMLINRGTGDHWNEMVGTGSGASITGPICAGTPSFQTQLGRTDRSEDDPG